MILRQPVDVDRGDIARGLIAPDRQPELGRGIARADAANQLRAAFFTGRPTSWSEWVNAVVPLELPIEIRRVRAGVPGPYRRGSRRSWRRAPELGPEQIRAVVLT